MILVKRQLKSRKKLPSFFKSLLWTYKFHDLDLEDGKKIIIANTINYGDLEHWSWIAHHYGKKTIQNVLSHMTITELRPPVGKLVSLLFGVKLPHHASRSSH